MNSDEIKNRLMALVEELDKMSVDFSKLKAEKDMASDMKKVRLAVIMADSNKKTHADREREALSSDDYREFLNELFIKQCNFEMINARKRNAEIEIDILRSLLSHDKTTIGLTT